uniref:Uncharacterized protein n=1 Tax=Melopsittacus undulatus TaxID=13146 RepID=A0A8C6IZE9_MELUD
GTPRTVRLRQGVVLLPVVHPFPMGSGPWCYPGLCGEGTEPLMWLCCFQRDCFYEGDIKDFPISLVVLSTCSGLRGILQLTNASYGIKPLEAAAMNQHLLYPVWNENTEAQQLAEKSSLVWPKEVPSLYLKMHVILDKDLSKLDAVAQQGSVVCLSVSLQMFAPLNLTMVLSSLEFWVEKNRIPTTGGAEELLQRFLQWKNEHRMSWLQDVMFLFVYREQSRSVGASSARKLCLKPHDPTEAGAQHPSHLPTRSLSPQYHRAMALEAFAVAVAQLLGLSLGMELEEPGSCQCTAAACIMQSSSM